MKMDDRLAQMNRRNNNKRRFTEEEEEDTLIYADRKSEGYLNESEGAFAKKEFGGINSQKDVFERTAVFHIK